MTILFLNLQITRSDVRPHIKWAVSLLNAYGHSNLLHGYYGYVWANTLTILLQRATSPKENKQRKRYRVQMDERYKPILWQEKCKWFNWVESVKASLPVEWKTGHYKYCFKWNGKFMLLFQLSKLSHTSLLICWKCQALVFSKKVDQTSVAYLSCLVLCTVLTASYF